MLDEEIDIFECMLLEWYDRNKRNFPWRYVFNPYKVFISEILLQQTNAEKIIKPYLEITNKYKNIRELSNANINDLKDIFKNIGLFYRANRMINISKEIVNKYDGKIPNDSNRLIKINGIGKYTCNAILCFGYNKPYAILDTNVIRIYKRVFDINAKSKRIQDDKRLWEYAQYMIPKDYFVDYNYAILDFGAEVCSSIKPKCNHCILRKICSFIYL